MADSQTKQRSKSTSTKSLPKVTFLSKQHKGKLFGVSYEPGHKKYAQESLDRHIAEYDEDLRVASLEVYQLADELKAKWDNRCPNCNGEGNITRVNRMRVYGGLFWTDSEPSPYKVCTNCGEQFEKRNTPSTYFESRAKVMIDRAKRNTQRTDLQPSDKDVK